MIWNGLTDNERLLLWKNLRKDIADKDFSTKLQSIADFYRLAPFGSRTIDYYDQTDWPTPWEILYHGSFCKSSISLLIFYTVLMVSPTSNVEMLLVNDSEDVYLLPLVDDQYVLNFSPGVVSNYQDLKEDIKIIRIFDKESIKKIR
jgi:hypothetical protein